ncbi:MAG: hypothetical protein ACC707_04105 [Thiohalomonadales bacterium]
MLAGKPVYPFWYALILLNLFTLYPRCSVADNDGVLSSSVSIELGADQAGGQEQFISLDTLIDAQHLVYFAYGRYQYTQSNRQRPDNRSNDIINQLYSFTVEDIADSPFNTGFGLEWWGNDNVLTMQTLNALLRYNWRYLSFDLMPQIQRIRFVDIPVFDSNKKSFDVSANGWVVSATYFSTDNWFLQLQHMENSYQIQESVLGILLARAENSADGRLAVRGRNGRYFDQATVLEVKRSTLTIGTSIDVVDIAVDWSQGESLIGSFISEDIRLSIGLPMANNFSVIGKVGQLRADAQSNLNYVNFSVTYHW